MEGSARPHVAMIVGNDVTADTRVKKTAASLARHGYRVTVLGLAPSGTRTETSMGQVQIVRLPVAFILRNRRRRKRATFTLPHLGYASKEQYVAAKRRSKVVERDFLAYAGRQRTKMRQARQTGLSLLQKLERRRIQSAIKTRSLMVRAYREVVDRREAMWRGRPNGDRSGGSDFLRTSLARLPTVTVGATWRRVLPQFHDYELSYGPELDSLEPDVIHAHDVHMIGIGERAAARGRLRGRAVRFVYDAHEYVPGLPHPKPRVLAALVDLEREYIRRADRVITVSDPIAEELARAFDLARKPAVVMNAPLPPSRIDPSISVRRAAGLNEAVPLLVYSGGLNRNRGIHTVVEALPLLPDTHLALVVKGESAYLRSLRARAHELDCGERLHVVPFVEPDSVATYLAPATAAVSALTHCGNHEVALPNKLFEYLHARLPVIVSDVKAMADFTRRFGTGEVFRAEDPISFADAAAKVLRDPDVYRRPLAERPEILRDHSWPAQEKMLLDVYRELLGNDPPALSVSVDENTVVSLVESKSADTSERQMVVALGPHNRAGQAWEWAKALERSYPHVRTRVFAMDRLSPVTFPSDVRIPTASWRSLEWQLAHVRHVLDTYTHVIAESGSAFFGTLNGLSLEGDLPSLTKHGIKVATVLHGSEVRDPRRHRELEPYSPFADVSTDLSQRLQACVDDLLPRLDRMDGPIFVSTMDLLDYVPDAVWLPVVVDTQQWTPGGRPLLRDRPVVVHAPSDIGLKGSGLIEQVVSDLHARGVIEYRQVQDVPADQMPEIITAADVVLDQFALGDYGTVAVQAMAAGRIVVGHVHERVRARLPENPPIVEATADSLGDVLQRILDRRADYADAAADGPAYVRRFHDGSYSAAQLAEFLGNAAGPLQEDLGTARSHFSPR